MKFFAFAMILRSAALPVVEKKNKKVLTDNVLYNIKDFFDVASVL